MGAPDLMGAVKDVVQQGVTRICALLGTHPGPLDDKQRPAAVNQSKLSTEAGCVAHVLEELQRDIARLASEGLKSSSA